MKKMSSGSYKEDDGEKMKVAGISVKRGVGHANFKAAGANVKRPGADAVDKKRK